MWLSFHLGRITVHHCLLRHLLSPPQSATHARTQAIVYWRASSLQPSTRTTLIGFGQLGQSKAFYRTRSINRKKTRARTFAISPDADAHQSICPEVVLLVAQERVWGFLIALVHTYPDYRCLQSISRMYSIHFHDWLVCCRFWIIVLRRKRCIEVAQA